MQNTQVLGICICYKSKHAKKEKEEVGRKKKREGIGVKLKAKQLAVQTSSRSIRSLSAPLLDWIGRRRA